MIKVTKAPNRNAKTESIRIPILVVDLLKDLSSVTGKSVQDQILEITREWIEIKKSKLHEIA